LVTRTSDGGRSFDVLTEGLPQQHAYDIVYRHGLALDATGDRLAIGSTISRAWKLVHTGTHGRPRGGTAPAIDEARRVLTRPSHPFFVAFRCRYTMRRIQGLDILQTLEDVCDPQRMALIVYDMQVGILKLIKNRREFFGPVRVNPQLTAPVMMKLSAPPSSARPDDRMMTDIRGALATESDTR
jgi:hypothetical protein